MAGKRHHIIPKFLQKGFASRQEGETVWTWLYHKNISAPREISTTDAIVSEHFYGKGENSADASITEFETSRLAPLVDSLRQGTCDLVESRREIAGLIAHFSIRTKLIRKGFEEASENFLSGVGEIFGDGELIGDAVANQSDAYMKEQFDEVLAGPETYPGALDAIKQLENLGISRDEVSSTIVAMLREHLNDPVTRQEISEGIGELFSQIFNPPSPLISESVKEGHIKGLKETPAPEVRIKTFEKFGWQIQDCDFDLILGDTATIFETVDHQTFVPICDLPKTKTVLLPISSRQLLIGSCDPTIKYAVKQNINHAIASCSFEQFVGRTDNHTALMTQIGQEPFPIAKDELEAELANLRENMRKMADGEHS